MNHEETRHHRNSTPQIDRRNFLTTATASGLVLMAPELKRSRAEMPTDGKVRLGAIADVHQDIMHDGFQRIEAFVSEMQQSKAQGIINLGDFCVPHPRNDSFLSAHAPTYLRYCGRSRQPLSD